MHSLALTVHLGHLEAQLGDYLNLLFYYGLTLILLLLMDLIRIIYVYLHALN